MRASWSKVAVAALALGAAAVSHAQISLATAVDFAFRSDPKILAAQADVDRARASLSEAKDAFVPVVVADGGVGKSTGVPLGLPTVFNINAQSLVFNYSQRDYIRAARSGWSASQLALRQAQDDAAEDVVNTYVALDNAQQRRSAAQDALDHAQRLLSIVQDRVTAGEDPRVEIPQTDLTVVEIQQQLNHVENEIAGYADHLARLTGLAGNAPTPLHDSIPALPSAATLAAAVLTPPMTNPGIEAAFANAQAKFETALGDARYLYRPQLSFGASYARITTDFSNYALYYPGFNPVTHPNLSYNALSLGVSIQLPLLDQAHRSKARESAADARRARYDALSQQDQFLEGRSRLQRSATDLDLSSRAANDRYEIAQADLETVLLQLQSTAPTASNATPLTPKDEQKARLAIAQRRMDLLSAELQLDQAKITLLRQNGQLSAWLRSATQTPNTKLTAQP